MHVTQERRHDRINILPNKFVNWIIQYFCDFWCTMLDNSNIFPFSWNNNNPSKRIFTIFFLIIFIRNFRGLENIFLNIFDSFTIFWQHLRIIKDVFHVVRVENESVDIVLVDIHQLIILLLNFFYFFEYLMSFFYDFILLFWICLQPFPKVHVIYCWL